MGAGGHNSKTKRKSKHSNYHRSKRNYLGYNFDYNNSFPKTETLKNRPLTRQIHLFHDNKNYCLLLLVAAN
jgi:hypothetical protein